MSDFVKYRIPGKPVELVSGQFQPWNGQDFGFLLADFDLNNILILQANGQMQTETLCFSEAIPEETSKEDFFTQSERIHEEIRSGAFEKIVLSRIKSASYNPQFLMDDFESLCSNYPSAFVYLVSSKQFGTWIGATPEILLQKSGESFSTVALASTKKVEDDSQWSQKELFEQGVVNEFIVNRLTHFGCAEVKSHERHVYEAGPLKHLRNVISFSSADNELKSLIHALHPTPAVSGFPQEHAVAFIETLERHDRSLYAGIIGVSTDCESNIYVNLRCAQVFENEVRLYLGGGHTMDSDAQAEWDETENKAKTLLNILQNH